MRTAPNNEQLATSHADRIVRDTVDATMWDFELNSHKFREVLTHWVCRTKPELRAVITEIDSLNLAKATFGDLAKQAVTEELHKKAVGALSDAIRYGAKV